ncbi:MAG: sulfurtransferase TusA family protein [Salibaculum sp.]|jgi:tRNA 2-thiouridine synthesizing protein A|uniref:sulfurtransferase TusA family protein n=1 Tax=Roseovarius halophilus (ex Wu et al. 2025) TaxID=3376060 RepID=UPI002870AD43|nr:sulfurtransferase TusA family protein [Salibaculum sp.]MDR9427008.1 sulfurtransferase TusA family protein [Salibaculum sp.]MDR9482955.1 sulfurtransferase TusA family protein [Salibaculum sp.]
MRTETPLDARGLKCPLPVLRAGKLLRTMAPGARLRVLADDPVAVIDIPHFCQEAGHVLLEQGECDGHQIYLIERGPRP